MNPWPLCRDVGGREYIPFFGRSVNPFPTGGTDYAHDITTGHWPPRFLDDSYTLSKTNSFWGAQK